MNDSGTARHLDPNTEKAVRLFLLRAAADFAFKAAWLFGSRARGSFRPDSDADIAILMPGRTGAFLDSKLELADIAYEVLLETGIRVQPLPIWEDEWQHPDTYVSTRDCSTTYGARVSVWQRITEVLG